MKQITILLLLISLVLCGCSGTEPEETTITETIPQDLVEIGNSDYYCIAEEQMQPSGSDGIAAADFTHRIYNPNYDYIVTLNVSVNGSFDQEDDSATIASVTGVFSDEQIEGLSLSQHLSEDTATIVVYLNQISVCHFQYRLYPDGTIKVL